MTRARVLPAMRGARKCLKLEQSFLEKSILERLVSLLVTESLWYESIDHEGFPAGKMIDLKTAPTKGYANLLPMASKSRELVEELVLDTYRLVDKVQNSSSPSPDDVALQLISQKF